MLDVSCETLPDTVIPFPPLPGSRGDYAGKISIVLKRSLSDFLSIGQLLSEAKANLSPSDFMGLWKDDLGISYSSAMRFMRIAHDSRLLRFPDVENAVNIPIEVADKLQSLPDAEFEKCLAGQVRTLDDIRDLVRASRTAHEHRPNAVQIGPPSRPAGAGAVTLSELVYLCIEWRKSLGVSQATLDQNIGGDWGEAEASKYEIPHTQDGRTFTLWNAAKGRDGTLFDYLAGLGLGIQLVPVA